MWVFYYELFAPYNLFVQRARALPRCDLRPALTSTWSPWCLFIGLCKKFFIIVQNTVTWFCIPQYAESSIEFHLQWTWHIYCSIASPGCNLSRSTRSKLRRNSQPWKPRMELRVSLNRLRAQPNERSHCAAGRKNTPQIWRQNAISLQ